MSTYRIEGWKPNSHSRFIAYGREFVKDFYRCQYFCRCDLDRGGLVQAWGEVLRRNAGLRDGEAGYSVCIYLTDGSRSVLVWDDLPGFEAPPWVEAIYAEAINSPHFMGTMG